AGMGVPTAMPAAVLRGPGQLSVEQVPVPEPGPDEVLVEVSHCGVCGSDLHMVLDGWGTAGRVGGHEWSGRVAVVGSGVHRWSPGDSVVGGAPTGCGKCAHCRRGRVSLCERRGPVTGGPRQGAFATYVLASATEAVGASASVLPESLVVPPMPNDFADDAYDVVLECSGRAEAMEVGLAQLGAGGRLVLVGAGIERPRLDNNRILLNELIVTGSYTYDNGGFEDALALLDGGAVPVEL